MSPPVYRTSASSHIPRAPASGVAEALNWIIKLKRMKKNLPFLSKKKIAYASEVSVNGVGLILWNYS